MKLKRLKKRLAKIRSRQLAEAMKLDIRAQKAEAREQQAQALEEAIVKLEAEALE